MTYTLAVASANPAKGVTITYGGTNTTEVTTNTTPFSLNVAPGGSWTFAAPTTAGGNNFSGWTGCTSTSGGGCTVTVSGNSMITANYVTAVAPTVTVTPLPPNIGVNQGLVATVTVAGPTGGATPTGSVAVSGGGLASAIPGTLSNGSVTLTIPANSLTVGSDTLTFTYTPDAASSANYSSVTQTATVTVNPLYTLTVNTTNPASGVTITASPTDANGHTSVSSSGTMTYPGATKVTLSAPATASGNTFSAWTGCTSTSGTTCNVTITANATVTAAYTAGPAVVVSPGTADVTIGSSQTFTATATGLSSSAVTWSVAVASGTGSAGTISSAGVYQSPFPAPIAVTVTATSTANSAIKGTATITLVPPPPAAGPALTVDAGTVTHAINPLIYGANAYLLDAASAQTMGITVTRWGGDATSRYNYTNANSNDASDYYFLNGGSYAMLTTNANSTTSEANFNDFIAETTALGIESIGTAPVLGYVANSNFSACSFPQSTYPNQAAYLNNCGNGIVPEGTAIPNTSPATTCTISGGCSFLGNSTTWQTTSQQEPPPSAPGAGGNTKSWATTNSWAGQWVNCLLSNAAPCADAAGKDATIWDLDNEPAWWDGVHRDVHPSPSTYDEVTNGGIGTALAIKAVDANAQVSGPVIDYWWNYFYSKKDIESGWAAVNECGQPWSNPVDREAHGGVPMIVYYLEQMAAASNTYGVRLLDYVDIHSYSAATYNGSSVGLVAAGDTGEQQARMNSTRALWDPTYTDPNFPQPNYKTDANYVAPPNCPAAEAALQAPQVIPMMQGWVTSGWTGTSYPAPKLSIDEYNFGGTESINGAVTQADVLGIFGKYGLDMGVFWPTTNYSTQVPGDMAFAIYRNYDGSKSTFGDNELSSSSANQGTLAVYAASRTSDGAVTIVVINKTYGPLTDTLSINNLTSTATQAQVYQYSNANLNAITSQPAATITAPVAPSTASTISAASSQPLAFPAQSITLLVIPPHS